MSHFAKFHKSLLEKGIYLGPSGYEVGFISAAHSDEEIQFAVKAMSDALDEVFSKS
jgi:glutamate-1-semialdehyde 2,1-aminomutase